MSPRNRSRRLEVKSAREEERRRRVQMGLPSSRFVLFHRLVLLPPLVLFTLTLLYTSSTVSPFSSTRRLSFSQDVQCFSCHSASSFASRSFRSLANFPASTYIRDIVLRHNALNVEDSRGETTIGPGSRRDANEVERSDYGRESIEKARLDDVDHRDTTRGVKEEEASGRNVVPQQVSVEEKPVRREKVEEQVEEVLAQVEEPTNRFPSDETTAEQNKVDKSVSRDNVALTEEDKVDHTVRSDHSTDVESSVSGNKNVDNSVQAVETSSETKAIILDEIRQEDDSSVPEGENANSSGKAEQFSSGLDEILADSRTEHIDSFVPEGKNVDASVQAEELSSGTKENSESNRLKENDHGSIPEDVGSSLKAVESTETKENFEGERKEDLQLENRHLTSDKHASPGEQTETPIDTNVSGRESVPSPPAPAEIKVMRFWHENMSKEVEIAGISVQGKILAIAKSGLPAESLNSKDVGDLDFDLLLQGGSPQGVPLQEERSCEGRHVFVYDLPSKFNIDLVGQCDKLLHWLNFCEYFKNGGMGSNVPTDELNDRGEKVLVPDGSWFLTHQYALELIFHARLKHYPCLTTDVNLADLFFVPYYAGLDVIRWHFKPNVTNDLRDNLTVELMNWLEGQETWSRNNGTDHVFVLGKISWDFRRSNRNTHWGSKLLVLPKMAQPTKLLIERDPWHGNDIGVPHPTFFHPKDDNEIRAWLAHVEQSERRYLVSFAGMPRPNMKANVRGHLIQQCLDNPDDCFLLRCIKTVCMRPDSTMNLFLHSHFCMQPPGDSPTRRSVFDSLVGGCIPVLFDPYTAYYQYPWHLPQNSSSYSVFIPGPDVMSGKSDIVEILKRITPEERTAMRTRIIREIIPGLLYSQPGTKHSDFRDSFDISIEALLNRVSNLRARQKFL